jgi:uncharacterized protein
VKSVTRPSRLTNAQDIRRVLTRYRRIAVVGLSPNTSRPSHQVAAYLQAHGYDIIPVNPACDEVLGVPCVPTLAAAANVGPLEIVDIFRRVEDIPPIVDEAIELGAKVVWMQLGLDHPEAAQKARDAGLDVIVDRCIKVEHARLPRASGLPEA